MPLPAWPRVDMAAVRIAGRTLPSGACVRCHSRFDARVAKDCGKRPTDGACGTSVKSSSSSDDAVERHAADGTFLVKRARWRDGEPRFTAEEGPRAAGPLARPARRSDQNHDSHTAGD